jgi:hypothetical protein
MKTRLHSLCQCSRIAPSAYDPDRCALCGGWLHPVARQILKEIELGQHHDKDKYLILAVLLLLAGLLLFQALH